ELIKKRNLPFGMVVKKIINQNILFTTLYKASNGNLDFPRGEGIYLIVDAYKVFPNGKEELVRGYIGSGFNAHLFKDILLCSNVKYCHNLLAQSVVSSFISGGDQYVEASIVAPDLLFED